MKVKITKTIEVRDLPREVRGMLDRAKNTLVHGLPEGMDQIIFHSLSSQSETFFETINIIDSFRQDLASLDESLQEAHNILSGYKQALAPEIKPEEEIHDPENLIDREAEYEKFMSRISGIEEQIMETEVEEDEEG